MSEDGPRLALIIGMSRRRNTAKPKTERPVRAASRRRDRDAEVQPLDKRDILLRRARRMFRQGSPRKAAVALRELAAMTDEPAHWVSLGHALAEAHREDEAINALKQGMWLHKQRGAEPRARVVARLILDLDPTDRRAARLAA